MAPEAEIVYAAQEAAEFGLPIAGNRIEAFKFAHQVPESEWGKDARNYHLCLKKIWFRRLQMQSLVPEKAFHSNKTNITKNTHPTVCSF